MTRRRAPLAPLSANVPTVSSRQRKSKDSESSKAGFPQKLAPAVSRPTGWSAVNKVGTAADEGALGKGTSRVPLPHPRQAALCSSSTASTQQQQGGKIGRESWKCSRIPKPPGLAHRGGERKTGSTDVAVAQLSSGNFLEEMDSDTPTALGPQSSAMRQEQGSAEKQELAAVDVGGRAGESPQELCGCDLDAGGYSFRPSQRTAGGDASALPTCSDSCGSSISEGSAASATVDDLDPLPVGSEGCGLHGSALRSMLSQYLFSPGSSPEQTAPGQVEGDDGRPLRSQMVDDTVEPIQPVNTATTEEEEESPFAVLCRKLYQSPTQSCEDDVCDSVGEGEAGLVAVLSQAESTSLEVSALVADVSNGSNEEVSRQADGDDGGGGGCFESWLAECNPQLRAALDSPAKRTLEEVWRAAAEAASLRKQLQALEAAASPARGDWLEFEDDADCVVVGGGESTARLQEARATQVQHEEKIRRDVTELQARLAALRTASESALAVAGALSNPLTSPPNTQPSSSGSNTQTTKEATLPPPLPPRGKEPTAMSLPKSAGGDDCIELPIVRPIHGRPHECVRVEDPPTDGMSRSSVNPLYDDDDSGDDSDGISDESSSSLDSSPDSVDRSRTMARGCRPWNCDRKLMGGMDDGTRPRMAASADEGVVGLAVRSVDEAAAAGRRWARARELQRRAKAMGLRV